MHYYIDGYNLLFRVLQRGDDLKSKRKEVITTLEAKTRLLDLDVTIVFDSHYQEDDHTRTHYKHLEIVFTATGETADEYILQELKEVKSPSLHTVVTSDKILARLCRIRLAKTESVDEFLSWLSKRYRNKLKQKKTSIQVDPLPMSPPPKTVTPAVQPPEEIPAEGCFDYYLSTFEAEYKVLENTASKPSLKTKKSKKLQPEKKIPLSPSPKDTHLSDMERWLRAFESE